MFRRITLVTIAGQTAAAVYHSIPEVDLVIEERSESRLHFLNRRRRRLGLSTVLGQILFQAGIVPGLKIYARNRIAEIQKLYKLDLTPIPDRKIQKVDSVNSQQTRQILQRSQPDLVVVHGTRIISQATLDSAACPWVNLHAGITPRYRGTHGAYWALYEGRPECCGVTLHRVDSGIDTGDILAQQCFAPSPGDNFVTYPWTQLGLGLELLKSFLANPSEPTRPSGPSGLYYHPTMLQYLKGLLRGVH